MANSIFTFINIVSFVIVFLAILFLLKKLKILHKDIQDFDTQCKNMFSSLEKKMCREEFYAREIKDDFKKHYFKMKRTEFDKYKFEFAEM